MGHKIISVDQGSIAEELGINPGDSLISLHGEPVHDIIDYEALSVNEKLRIDFETATGEPYEAEVEKDLYEPLGLNFESGLMSPMRSCQNRCVFCFIDQMPKGVRDTLHVKDDDWRLSLFMGNYVTLTNVDDAEFGRIIHRRVSPLYISVHATDGEVRHRMMNNKHAGRIMERLNRLRAEGLRFYTQIVLCPGLNDKAVLQDTLCTLYSLQPAAQSVAVVPVGLTRYRKDLYPLRPLTEAEAAYTLGQIEALQGQSLKEFGTRFVFASDELYILAGRPLPPYESYEDFSQIENGVGLLRQFENGFLHALGLQSPLKRPRRFDSVSGVSAAPFLQTLFSQLMPYGIEIRAHAVENNYFGSSVTVSGLITPTDMVPQLAGHCMGEALLLPLSMLRENDYVFLDGESLDGLKERLRLPVYTLPAVDGEEFIEELFSFCKE